MLLRLLSLAGRRASLLQLRSAACAGPAGQAARASSMLARCLPAASPLPASMRDGAGLASMLCCRGPQTPTDAPLNSHLADAPYLWLMHVQGGSSDRKGHNLLTCMACATSHRSSGSSCSPASRIDAMPVLPQTAARFCISSRDVAVGC